MIRLMMSPCVMGHLLLLGLDGGGGGGGGVVEGFIVLYTVMTILHALHYIYHIFFI